MSFLPPPFSHLKVTFLAGAAAIRQVQVRILEIKIRQVELMVLVRQVCVFALVRVQCLISWMVL